MGNCKESVYVHDASIDASKLTTESNRKELPPAFQFIKDGSLVEFRA